MLREALEDKRISEIVARLLAQINDPEKQRYYLRYAMDGGATADVVRGWVAREKAAEAAQTPIGIDYHNTSPENVPPPVLLSCKWCKGEYDANQLTQLLICQLCNQILEEMFTRTREEVIRERNEIDTGKAL